MRAAQFTTLVLACALIAGCSKPTSSNTTTTTTETASSSPTSLADAAAATTPPAADASAGATSAAATAAATAIASPAANATSSASTAANASATTTTSTTTTATTQPAAVTVAFTDISGNYAEKAIVGLGQLGVLDSTSGAFQPSKPVLRREFVRWLFKTNNAVFADTPGKQIHPAESGDKSGFTDVQSSDPDFKYIEGMDEAGISVGFPDKTFKGDQPLTHEQAIAIKAVLDRGGVADRYRDAEHATFALPEWKDKTQISKAFAGAISTDHSDDEINSNATRIDNVGRAFGAVAMFRPRAPVTRAQAAMLIQVIGAHTPDTNRPNEPRSVAATLNPTPKPTP
jgi:S-layer homology domain